jgi:hypothetical protein
LGELRRSQSFVTGLENETSLSQKRKKPPLHAQRRLFPWGRSDYFEAAEAAASAAIMADEAAASAALAAAEASGAGAGATITGASTLGSSFLLQAVRATAANREANRIDLFILVLKRLNDGAHHNFGAEHQCIFHTNCRPRKNKTRKTSSASLA